MAGKLGMGFLGILFEALGIFLGFDFCPHSIIPVTWNPEYPMPPQRATYRNSQWNHSTGQACYNATSIKHGTILCIADEKPPQLKRNCTE